jgi:protein-disulfide isomerase
MHLLRLAPVLFALVAASESTCRGSGSSGGAPSGGAAPSGDVELAGVDTGSLTPREKREWSSYVSELLAPCPNEPVSIAQCVKESRHCAKCLPAAQLLLKQVREGRSRSQAEDAFYARFSPDRIKNIDLSDSPSKGAVTAPVTVVEFADFECPHCRHAYPILDKLVDEHPGKVRLMFKYYPLQAHPHGEAAARAAAAAALQGKFWEMHHLLFDHQDALEPRDLEKYAKEAGCDVAKWKTDFESEAIADRVARDRKQGDQLSINGTPTLYVNGREYDLAMFDMGDDLSDWVKLDIALAEGAQTIGAPPKAAASTTAIAPTSGLVKASDKKP